MPFNTKEYLTADSVPIKAVAQLLPSVSELPHPNIVANEEIMKALEQELFSFTI